MAKKKEEEIINIHETYGRLEGFIEDNKKTGFRDRFRYTSVGVGVFWI